METSDVTIPTIAEVFAMEVPETSTEPSQATPSPSPTPGTSSYNPSLADIPPDLQYFLITHEAQVRMWIRAHGNFRFPVYKDEATGNWVWVNRQERRRFRKFGNKKGPKL
jgi:hypothetical protein